jgi:hypothetical protein
MFANHGKEDGIYPLTTIDIAKAQKKDHQIYSKNMWKHQSGFAFSTYWRHNSAIYGDENQSSQHL